MATFLYPSTTSAMRTGVLLALAAGVMMAWLALTGASAFAASQYVVISAEPASNDFPPGKVLAIGDSIEVPDNASLTLLGEDGSVVTIPGHAKVTVTPDALETKGEATAEAEKNRSTLSKLATLLSGEHQSADSLGVSRGFDPRKEVRGLADPWVLSVHKTARGCVRNEPIRLGRSSANTTVSVRVRGDSADASAELDWKAGDAVLTLPDTISPDNSQLLIKTAAKTVAIELDRIPDDVNQADPMAVLGWMVAEGCNEQALAFTRLLVHQAQ